MVIKLPFFHFKIPALKNLPDEQRQAVWSRCLELPEVKAIHERANRWMRFGGDRMYLLVFALAFGLPFLLHGWQFLAAELAVLPAYAVWCLIGVWLYSRRMKAFLDGMLATELPRLLMEAERETDEVDESPR